MRFVALVSGGKDSCFNIAKCISHGHELVCLANLCPPREFLGDDMDSFMYQTAASNVLSAFSACFGVPMVQVPIKGRPLVQHLGYEANPLDEVEDMALLLQEVKRRFPDVTAVSCGAILSNYQRFRVEDVCSRLGLVPLDYLWQRDRRSLLNEMVEHGVHAVLVKVSGGGLDPLKHLGRDLAALVPTFERLHDRFGLDICGEGGEYETMVLDMPMFKQRIEILESEVVCDGNDISVGHLRIHSFRVVPKIEGAGDGIRASNIWIDECLDTAVPCSRSGPLRALPSAIAKTAPPCSAPPSVDGLGCTSLLIPDVSPAVPTEERVEKQIESLMIQLSAIMEHFGGAIADACFVHLYVSDMSNFGAVNSAYSKYFGRNPPSRSCIAAVLPLGIEVALHATYLVGSHGSMGLGRSARREVLHVRSQSEWAPMCIGPYSQANCLANSIVLIAGQIALLPETMNVLEEGISNRVSSETIIKKLFDNSELSLFKSRFSDAYSSLRGRDIQFRNNGLTDVGNAHEFLSPRIICELLLSIRNAFQVASCLNSSTEFTISCFVFVNVASIPPSMDPAKLVHYLRLLTKYVLINQPEYQWSKIAPLIGAEATKTPMQEDDDDSNQSDDEIRLYDAFPPVIVVPVPSLPRNAAVEVEIISTSTAVKAKNIAFTEIEWDASQILGCMDLLSSSIHRQERSLPCWPLLMSARGVHMHPDGEETTAENSTDAAVSHSFSRIFSEKELETKASAVKKLGEDLSGGVKCRVEFASILRCMCSGFSTAVGNASDARQASRAIVFSVADALRRSQLQWSNLCYLTLFSSSDTSSQTLGTEAAELIREVFGETVTVHTIRIPDVPGASQMTGSFLAVDLLQIKTELWIRGD